MVTRVDPESGRRILPRDRKRLVRALEVYFLTGRPLTAHFAETVSPLEFCEVVADRLAHAGSADLDARGAEGGRAVRARPGRRGARARSRAACPSSARPFGGLVYRQVIELLRGVRDEAATRALIAQENRRYARRQLIWFRKEPNLVWFDGPGELPAVIERAARALDSAPGADTADAEYHRHPPARRAAEHPGRVPQLRPAGAARRGDSPAWTASEFEGRIKNFDRFALIVEQDGADQMMFKHAIASIRSPRVGRELPGLAGLTGAPRHRRDHIRLLPRHRPRARQRRHRRVAGCAQRTVTRAATRSATSRAQVALEIPTLQALGLGASSRSRACRRRASPTAAFGRMAERSAGKDSVTGHWEMMGLVLDRAFPTFPHGFPARPHRASSRRASAARRSATSSPPARRSSTSSARSTCGRARRSSTRPRTASSRSPHTRTSSRCRSSIGSCEAAYGLVGRGTGRGSRHRATVRRHGGPVHPHGESPRLSPCRREATRCSIGWPRRPPGRGDRQDLRSVRRARRVAARPYLERRRGHGRGDALPSRASRRG